MLDLAHYDAAGRRELAEAQGWAIQEIECGAFAVFPPGASDWTLASHDGEAACIKALPDPLRDAADFANLFAFLLWQFGAVQISMVDTDSRERFQAALPDTDGCWDEFGTTMNEALVGAALAWLAENGENPPKEA